MSRREFVISVIALLLLATGIASSLYLHSQQINRGDFITVGNEKIYMDDIFKKCRIVSVEVNDKGVMKNYTGALLSDIINMSKIKNPEEHKYTIAGPGKEGGLYQKTVEWNDMKNGILTEDKRTIFPNLPRAFWIKDVIKIEVI